MSVTHSSTDKFFLDFLEEIEPKEPEVLKKIRLKNKEHRLGHMMIAPLQVNFLIWIARLIHVKNYLEVGVFTGYSSTAMALSLPSDAKLTLCDINVSYTDLAREAWIDAEVENKIDLRLQPALITLQDLLLEGKDEFYDLVLIDADKWPTQYYVDYCYPLVRRGGVIAIDNTLLNGRVLKKEKSNESLSLSALRKFNQNIYKDVRFCTNLLPIGDGLTLLIKQ